MEQKEFNQKVLEGLDKVSNILEETINKVERLAEESNRVLSVNSVRKEIIKLNDIIADLCRSFD